MTLRALIILAALTLAPLNAPPCGGISCDWAGGGAEVGFTESEVRALAQHFPQGSRGGGGSGADTWYAYSAVIDCVGNDPDNPEVVLCERAVTYCEENVPGSSGPYSIIYRRVVDSGGPLSGWERVGPTCYTAAVPPRSGEALPELTEAMIIEQFHRTHFAAPRVLVQPADNRALVNSPVYFELSWPEEGHQPMEIDTTVLVGREVRIRPTLAGATYDFGDGHSHGPTTSLGGPYPTGDVTHEYAAEARVTPYITVIYGGDVSVDGADWVPIPGSVTVDGPTQPLQILTSTNRLYED